MSDSSEAGDRAGPIVDEYLRGMYVRVPVVESGEMEGEGDFRSFRLAQVDAIDLSSGTLTGKVYRPPLGMSFAEEVLSARVEHIQRCHIFPGTPCVRLDSGEDGIVLGRIANEFVVGSPQAYYVAIQGTIQRIAETDLIVPGDAQDPNPQEQMRRYEFHEPGFRSLRDPVIEGMAELRSATYGLEELVGSRVLLLPHQAEVITRALADRTCRFVLADEVGLGKTIEAAMILKGLRRRNPGIRALIVAPSSLTHQWANELGSRFWMNLDLVNSENAHLETTEEGAIISTEDLSSSSPVFEAVMNEPWDCVIVDEAHHVRKSPVLQQRLIDLSRAASAVLILSATPIEKRGVEYLDLLRLMDPARYCQLSSQAFQKLLDAQAAIRSSVEYIRPTLTTDMYDAEEFIDELQVLLDTLPDDEYLADIYASAQDAGIVALGTALDVITHVNTNYRVESRVLRNRRAHLETTLPTRSLDTGWSYLPTSREREAIDAVLDYCESILDGHTTSLALEYVRLLIHAIASSPAAITSLIELRTSLPHMRSQRVGLPLDVLINVQSSRNEPHRITTVIEHMPRLPDEQFVLERVRWAVDRWKQEDDERLRATTLRSVGLPGEENGRLSSVLKAIYSTIRSQSVGDVGKVIVFSSWGQTLDTLAVHLTRIYGSRAFSQFRAGMSDAELEHAADTFQSDRSCQILLTDELGGEGRNFQIAKGVLHVDLPWSPARIEQRIGRVDRLGRTGDVLSIVPYARETVEESLFRLWNEVFDIFSHSMSGMEIALEEVQNDLLSSLRESVRHGLTHLLPRLLQQVEGIRDQVERERYFEEGAINQRQRAEFNLLREKYHDGKVLERTILPWASRAGLRPDFDSSTGITKFSPKNFNAKSMENANILTLPDMDEAIRRAGRRFAQSIQGTFSRDLAIFREDLVFYAPGDDPWFEWIVQNAERADRGRCCAIIRPSNKVTRSWKGLELLYRIDVDPRPLYEEGFDPVHLFRARGYLNYPIHRILVSEDGNLLPMTSEFGKAISAPYSKSGEKDIHFGKRSGKSSPLSQFRRSYPADVWDELTARLFSVANCEIREEFSFLGDLGEEAREELQALLRNAESVRTWRDNHLGTTVDADDGEREHRIIDALVEGISNPSIRLESACYWWVYPKKA